MTSGDTCVTINIDGLPVTLVLPERDAEMYVSYVSTMGTLQEGRGDE